MSGKNKELLVNQKHKDRLFRFIFGAEENRGYILSLYNALQGTDYKDPDEIKITTLDDVLYLSMKNDVSFILASDMNLFEHQSTYNPNMPLRGFLYFSMLYRQYIALHDLDIYGRNLVRIPTPRYVVFYNGEKICGDRTELRLSDAFMGEAEGCEWTATMLNINKGHNRELMEQCRVLGEYSDFVALVRENRGQGMAMEEAVDRAVQTACDWKCLGKFMKKHRSEVRDLCLLEYDEELHEKTLREEGREQGREETRLETAGNFFKNGASLELVHASIPEIPLTELERIYREVTEKEK